MKMIFSRDRKQGVKQSKGICRRLRKNSKLRKLSPELLLKEKRLINGIWTREY
jgi:hypothetical protein